MYQIFISKYDLRMLTTVVLDTFFLVCTLVVYMTICFYLNILFSVQEYFVRKSNAKKGMLASTHLVLKEPGGSKYEAAKKWNLPAVNISWLLETARTGKRASESHFLIEKSTKEG